ncbi:MAG: amidohydrolase [Planctomycetota bacterium]|nr:amidohydrolase [Planctomycetota bacterium]
MPYGSPQSDSNSHPDAIFLNGNIYTLTSSRVEALAVREGNLIAAGSTRDISKLASRETECIDLGGQAVTPGLMDSHGHMTSLGRLLTGKIDLSSTKSFQDLLSAVRAQIEKRAEGEWIFGGRWDQTNWGDDLFPPHHQLSSLSPNHPVFLHRRDGHAVLVNQKAMDLAGIDLDSKSPQGGEILRDSNGELTGIFVDNAMSLFDPVLPAPQKIRMEILAAQEHCLSLGLTGVHDAGIDPAEVDVYETLEKDRDLHLRIYGMLFMKPGCESILRERTPKEGDRFSLRAIKILLDGALGSRGAWLKADYSDSVGSHGFPLHDMSTLGAWVHLAAEKGWQVCTHAIGDRAVGETLDAYEHVRGERPRIEHAQMIGQDDLSRFSRLGVIASVQPVHATSDMRWVEERLGRGRLRGAYAWRSLLREGVALAGGSDFPVEPADPWKGIYAAVTRQDSHGMPVGGWIPEEKLTREEALHAFTVGAAYASFEEHRKGTLVPGKFADFVVWSADPMTCSDEALLEIRAERTVIGGKSVYQRS